MVSYEAGRERAPAIIARFFAALLLAAWPVLVPTQTAYAAACAPTYGTATVSGTAYRTVTFTTTGTCDWQKPASVSTVDALLVGGGGGGGSAGPGGSFNYGGGGGGGQVVISSAISLTATTSVTVGAGGASGANGTASSVFSGATERAEALGGGKGEKGDDWFLDPGGDGGASGAGLKGGSGGGQGGGGGGGALAEGNAGSINFGGNGGAGLTVTFTGSSLAFGGGGGGGDHETDGSGGLGGGGKGGIAGTANTGGGGGGGSTLGQNGNPGGSGIVILRYALLTPALGVATSTEDGFTAQISNYTALATWSVASTAGSATLSPSGLVTVTGLTPGQSTTLTVSVDQDTRAEDSQPLVSSTLTASALNTGLKPEFDEPVPTEDGFTVAVSNYINDYTWVLEPSEGEAELDEDGVITVTDLELGESSEVTVITSREGYTEEREVVEGQSWFPPLVPEFSAPEAGDKGFQVAITNFDRAFTWQVTSNRGRASVNPGSGLITITGLSDGAAAQLTVKSTRDGYAPGEASVSGASLRAALTPRFGAPVSSDQGFEAAITNFDAAYSWSVSASAGTARLQGSTLRVTGVEPGETSTVVVSTSRDGYLPGSAPVSGKALDAPATEGTGSEEGSDGAQETSAETTNPVNELGPVLETLLGPISLVNIFTDRAPIGPVLDVSVDLEVDTEAANKSVEVDASKMLPGSSVVITIYSTPTEIAQGVVDELGNAAVDGSLPGDLPPGVHTLEVMGVGEDGSPAQSIGAFEIDERGVIVGAVAPGQTSEPIEPGSDELLRALEAGAEIYDPTRFPTETAALAVAAAASAAAIGAAARAGGGSGSSTASQSSGSEGGELGSIWDEELEGVEARKRGPGDRSRLWRHRRTKEFDQSVANLMVASSRWVRLPSRLMKESTWSRTQFGEYGLLTWVVGVALGFMAGWDTGWMALPPTLWILLGIVFVGILDGMAGALAWVVIATGAVVAGNVSVTSDVRSLMGIFVLVVALPLISSAARPLRRSLSGESTYLFDRISDYLVASVVAVVCGTAMYTALNGLSGLEIVPLEATWLVQVVIVAGIVSRGLCEDVTLRLFPRRLAQLSSVETDYPPAALSILSVLLRASAFVFVATSFLGVDWKLIFIGLLFATPLILYVYYDNTPNSETLFRFLPRGMSYWLLLTVVGILTAAWILGRINPSGDVIAEYIIFFLPWTLMDILFAFGKEGRDWPDGWLKRIVGIPVVAYTAALLMGWVGFFGL